MNDNSGSMCSSPDSYQCRNVYHASVDSPSKSHKSETLLKGTNIWTKIFSRKTYKIHKSDEPRSSECDKPACLTKNKKDIGKHNPSPSINCLNVNTNLEPKLGERCCDKLSNDDKCSVNNDIHSDDFHISVTFGGQVFVPRASNESLDHLEESSRSLEPNGFTQNIPTIHEDFTSISNGVNNNISNNFQPPALKTSLLCPLPYYRDISRNSSTGDSAVDMKFQDDEEASSNNYLLSSNSESPTNFFSEINPFQTVKEKNTQSVDPWSMVRNIIVPFVQQSNKRRYPWIQLSGHQGNFRSGAQGTILKKLCSQEADCLNGLMSDPLGKFVPCYKGITEKDGEKYVEMEDLLLKFENPSIMDCKIGVRTYLEQELTKARQDPNPRKDMYDKMIEVDPNEPTEEEHKIQGVTKPRYMQWRETISSSCELGFRIEGYKKYDQLTACEFKRIKTKEDLIRSFKDFVNSRLSIVDQYINRLNNIRTACETSNFFRTHEFIGSSLLFVYDRFDKANVWMIDFGKTRRVDAKVSLNHRSAWMEGNHEDGYLMGLDNIMEILLAVRHDIEAQV